MKYLKNHPLKSIVVIFGIIGLLVSIYLAYEYAQDDAIVCATDCETVRNSGYATFLGIEFPYWGILFYSWIIGATIATLFKIRYKKVLIFLLNLSTITGFGFSLYLTMIEAFVIEAWCQWCVVSAICATVIFFAHLLDEYREARLTVSG